MIVVGAGAAGIIASWRAASLGARTLLLEKTNRIGTKILISGGGKCNITHDGEIEDVLRAFRENERRFIRPACYRFRNHQIVKMLTDRGLKVYTRPDGRIFPVDQTAKDVVGILRTYLVDAGVRIRLEAPVTGISLRDDEIRGIKVGEETIECSRVIVATGGSSYPNSGTTGDGWQWARTAGHSIIKVRAALAPIYLEAEALAEFSGVALRYITLKAREGTKEIARWKGDLLFTHRGISGPCALGISRAVVESMERGPVHLEVDLDPSSSFEETAQHINDWCQHHPRKQISSITEQWVPKVLGTEIILGAGLQSSQQSGELSQKAKNRLTETVKGWKLGAVKAVPLEKGECVAGGIALDEVDPQSMRSKIAKGLYLCGEVLDIAGPVGGYNLQSAFATGYVAGESAAKDAGF